MQRYQKSFTIIIVATVSIAILGASYFTSNPYSTSVATSSTTTSTTSTSTPSSCGNCVVISTVYLNVQSQGMDSSCWNQGLTVLTQNLGIVFGPGFPSREFSYSFSFMGNTMNDMQGVGTCDSGPTVEGFSISPSSAQFTLTSVLPSLPATISPGTQIYFTLYLASQQAYSGPITIEMQLA